MLQSIEVAVRTLRAPVKILVALHADMGAGKPGELLASFPVDVLNLPRTAGDSRRELTSENPVSLIEGYTYWVVMSGLSGEGAVWHDAEPLRAGGQAYRINGGNWIRSETSWRSALRVVTETRPKR